MSEFKVPSAYQQAGKKRVAARASLRLLMRPSRLCNLSRLGLYVEMTG